MLPGEISVGTDVVVSPLSSNVISSGGIAGSRPPPPSVPARIGAAAPSHDSAVALYDFNGEREGDLSFRKGDTIVILNRGVNDWWTGRCNGMEGVFPSNYVQLN